MPSFATLTLTPSAVAKPSFIQRAAFPAACIVLFFFFFYHAVLGLGASMEDDPYIYIRFARQYLATGTVAFNPGQPLIGFTSLLQFYWVVLLTKCFTHVPRALFISGMAQHAFASVLVFLFFYRFAPRRNPFSNVSRFVFSAGAAWIYNQQTILIESVGMETGWLEILIVLTFILYFRGRDNLALATSALLIWVRPDAAMLPAALLAAFAVRRRYDPARFPWFGLAALVICAGVWLGFNQHFGQAWLPSTLSAKRAQGAAGGVRSFGVKLVTGGLPRHEKQYLYYLFLLVLVVRFGWWAWRGHRWFLLLPAWTLLYALTYAALRVPYYYIWYYVPLVVGLWLMAGLGAVRFNRDFAERPWLHMAAWLCLFWASILLIMVTHFDPMRLSRMATTENYFELAKYIRTHAPRGATIATVEIGVPGYALPEYRFVDLESIITSEIAPHLAVRDFGWAFEHFKPDYVIAHEPPLPDEAPVVTGALRGNYERVYSTQRSDLFGRAMVLRRR